MDITQHHTIRTPTLTHTSCSDWNLVYEPAEDTFLMLDALQQDFHFIRARKPPICLEVGCGAGVVITALSQELCFTTHAMAIDINPHACALTQATAKHNSVCVDVLQADLMSALRSASVDMIVFNPPYVLTTSDEMNSSDILTKSWAGGVNGREVIDKFINILNCCLNENSFGYILLLKENRPEEVTATLEEKKFHCRIIASRKLRGEELCVVKFYKNF